jgi:SpoVK/Ycf46/Vps4 family AAA+-type ATPase
LSLYNPSAFTFGVLARSSSPGVLLYGPPGTGKTLLAKALAKQTHATFLTFSSADIRSKYVGEGEKKIKRIFAYARKHHPCIVFIDEADSLFRSRSAEDSCRGHLSDLNQFLEEMEGIKSKDARCPMVIAATNRPFDIDEGILRRLRKRILVDVPDARAREQILKIHLRGEPIADDVDLSELVKELAKTTQDYTGSDLETLVHEAAIAAEGENQYRMRTETPIATASSKASHRVLRRAHFVYAKQVVPASPKSDLVAKIMEFHNKFGATTQRNGGASGRAEVMNKRKSSVSL